MKKIFFTLFTFIYIASSQPVSAHMIGQPPFFKVNDVFTDFYNVPSTSLDDFLLPQDLVKEQYLVNEEIKFEIDKNALPVPPEVVEKTKFLWDFGDGTKGSGLKNTHSYAKQGTYFLDLKADSGEGYEPQLLQTTAINIVSDHRYKLPKAAIEVNGKQSKDPLIDIIDVNFNKEIAFDGSKSTGGDSQITEYFWDLGDISSSNNVFTKYKYKDNPYTVFPLLRIKTKDGFISDAFVQIRDGGDVKETVVNNPAPGFFNRKTLSIITVGLLIFVGVIIWIISRLFSRKRN